MSCSSGADGVNVFGLFAIPQISCDNPATWTSLRLVTFDPHGRYAHGIPQGSPRDRDRCGRPASSRRLHEPRFRPAAVNALAARATEELRLQVDRSASLTGRRTRIELASTGRTRFRKEAAWPRRKTSEESGEGRSSTGTSACISLRSPTRRLRRAKRSRWSISGVTHRRSLSSRHSVDDASALRIKETTWRFE